MREQNLSDNALVVSTSKDNRRSFFVLQRIHCITVKEAVKKAAKKAVKKAVKEAVKKAVKETVKEAAKEANSSETTHYGSPELQLSG